MSELIINIIFTVTLITMCIYAGYCETGKTVREKAIFLISTVARLNIVGTEKMKMVVNTLYNEIPLAFKKILTKERLQTIAQELYDNMKAFAQLDK